MLVVIPGDMWNDDPAALVPICPHAYNRHNPQPGRRPSAKEQTVTRFGLLLAVIIGGGLNGQLAADPPNVIIFIADDMAVDDCGAYGHPKIRTPNIDSLARAGMTFTNAFLTTSSCSPSRCSILTGRYPHATGGHQLHLPLPGSQVTMANLRCNCPAIFLT